MMVDGPRNTVYECDSVALPPGPENPYGNAWVVRQTPLRRESEAQRVADGRAARSWRITNPGRQNATGEPVAYRLMPQDSVLPFGEPDTHIMRRASSPPSTCGSPRTTPISGSRPGNTPTSTPAGTACRPGPRPTARWKTPTWCSGTHSPLTTSCARKTGR